jgi:hypothetical protein
VESADALEAMGTEQATSLLAEAVSMRTVSNLPDLQELASFPTVISVCGSGVVVEGGQCVGNSYEPLERFRK